MVETSLLLREEPDYDYVQYTESLGIVSELAGEAEANEEQPRATADIEDHRLPGYITQLPTPEDTPAPESSKPSQSTTAVPNSFTSDSTEPHEASTIDVRPAEAEPEADEGESTAADYTLFGTTSQPNRLVWITVTINSTV